jgi:glutathione S-transferase
VTITLYGFGPALGLPEISPFVTKTHILLKMAGLHYQTNVSAKGFLGAPKGKLPYIRDGDAVIADSTFIRLYIEKTYGSEFDKDLSPAEKALGWALERMCEERLYWLMVDQRWLIDANFAAGPERIFDGLPTPARPLVKAYMRRVTRKTLRLQGVGRHSPMAKLELARRDFAAISDALGDKQFLFGDEPKGADATLGAFNIGALAKLPVSTLAEAAAGTPHLAAYADRMSKRFLAN